MTPKREVFCSEYLVDLNGTQAAIRSGYSPTSAARIALELLSDSEIEARIEFLMAERMKRIGVNQDFVLEELMRVARSEIGSAKVRALELIGKHLRMFSEKLDINIDLARKAEEYTKLTSDQQIELMKEELKKMEAQRDQQKAT